MNRKHPHTENTPLHIGAMNGHAGCVTALLGYGADRDLINRQVTYEPRNTHPLKGFKAHQLAIQAGHHEIANAISRFDTSKAKSSNENNSTPPKLESPISQVEIFQEIY